MKYANTGRARILLTLLMMVLSAACTWSQGGSRGSVAISVTDSGDSLVSGAKLTLVDQKTKDTRTAVTLEKGNYVFSGLLGGTYALTIEKDGFQTQNFTSVLVLTARTTDITVKLTVGRTTENVTVQAESSPLVESTSNAIGSNLDVKQIEDLPLSDRNISGLANYVAGASGGIFNGMRGASQTNTIDGVVANSSRMKDYSNASPAAAPRIENIEEMVVQTDQLDLNQGFGQANMQVGFTTRRGGDAYHGRVFADLQNSSFNAPGWMTDYYASLAHKDASRYRAKSHKNEFGGSVGGPVPYPSLSKKLFFFASYSKDSVPGSASGSNNYPNASLQSGIYTYTGTDNANHSVDLFALAGSLGIGARTSINANVKNEFTNINAAVKSGLTGIDANDALNIEDVKFNLEASKTWHYPTFRVDYNVKDNLRINLAFNETKYDAPTGVLPWYPGSSFETSRGKAEERHYTASLGVEWTIKPTLLNQLRGGYLYTYAGSVPLKSGHTMDDVVWWNMPEMNYYSSGDIHLGPVTHFYPLGSLSDNLVWQHKSHNVVVGASWYREQDHYWDNPLGYNNIVFGSIGGDPVASAFVDSTMPKSSTSQQSIAWNFYTLLSGRLNTIAYSDAYNHNTGKFAPGAVNLNERQQAVGLFAQDSWRITPHVTLNYGMRWDFTGDTQDLNGVYHSVSKEDVFGKTGYMNLFNPGSFKNANGTPSYVAGEHAYDPWKVSPQPSVAISWNPVAPEGFLHKLLGEGTVIRAGYALRNYTEAYQNFWNFASNAGAFFYNNTSAMAALPNNGTQATGTYAPGAYQWGDSIPSSVYLTDYTQYQKTVTEESMGYLRGISGMNKQIKQPYIQSWNLGIQHELGQHNAIEVRYVGNHAIHEWIPLNVNEVNIFENGFLSEFKKAQSYLTASGGTNFGGANPATNLPILNTSFGGDTSQFTNQTFITYLQNGRAGSFAYDLTQASYMCNLVGDLKVPCQTNAGMSGTGVGTYPNNFFVANPYAAHNGAKLLDAAGSSNYHSLQIEYRAKGFHGANFTANYTWAKNLGVRPYIGGDSSNFTMVSMRNLRWSYAPSDTDRRHSFNLLGTYDLPVGKGKLLNIQSRALNAAVGNWTIGTITTFKSGLPFQLTGGNYTYNDTADGGIVLNNITLSQLRKSVGVHRKQGANYAYIIDPKYISSNYLSPNTTPGTLGLRPWLWGPHAFNTDLSLSKAVTIRSGVKFSLQGEFLNAFNHPTFGVPSDVSVADLTGAFGRSSPGGARTVEIRANIEF